MILLPENYKASNTISGATSHRLRNIKQPKFATYLSSTYLHLIQFLFENIYNHGFHLHGPRSSFGLCTHLSSFKPTMENTPRAIINQEELQLILSGTYGQEKTQLFFFFYQHTQKPTFHQAYTKLNMCVPPNINSSYMYNTPFKSESMTKKQYLL